MEIVKSCICFFFHLISDHFVIVSDFDTYFDLNVEIWEILFIYLLNERVFDDVYVNDGV